MGYQHTEPISKQLTIVVGLTVVGFMAFGLALSFYRNVLFEQTLGEIEEQNKALRDRITDEQGDLEYYRSDQYKDKYAKENLNKVKAGEKVLIISQAPSISIVEEGDTVVELEEREATYLELLQQMPTIEHWQLYFFHKEEIEELKDSVAE